MFRYQDREIIRMQRLTDGKVFIVELPKKRDEMSLEEFEKIVKERMRPLQ